MKQFDAAVIGGGILGCFAARNLQRWKLSSVLIEAEEDVCTGITRANAAIVYAGYDNRAGSRKAAMTLRGNAEFHRLCQELDVPFSRCGSLMVSFTPEGDAALRKKFRVGRECGVPGLALISGQQARELEPMLADGITAALYAPSTGTVNPWQLGIAAYENAAANGCEGMLNSPVRGIRKVSGGYVLQMDREEIFCRMVINCAGAAADRVQEMVFAPSVRLFADAADFLVLDKRAKKPERIIFHQAAEHGKGITAIPTVEGNLLLGPTRRPQQGLPYGTTAEGLAFAQEDALRMLPGLDLGMTIRSFGALRPNPHRVVLKNGAYVPDGTSIGSFVIERPAADFISLIGIKTPGLTCAQELGDYLAAQCAEYLDAQPNLQFQPERRGILRRKEHPDYYEIICRCESVTRGEILEAITRGARTVDGVKRRTGSGMGRCQGSRCAWEIAKILKETGANPDPLF